jgi:hypothetical protein
MGKLGGFSGHQKCGACCEAGRSIEARPGKFFARKTKNLETHGLLLNPS